MRRKLRGLQRKCFVWLGNASQSYQLAVAHVDRCLLAQSADISRLTPNVRFLCPSWDTFVRHEFEVSFLHDNKNR